MNWTIKPFKQFKGNINVPADKSITHRAVMLAAIANGKSIIINYLDGEDCMCTVQAFRSMGVKIEKDKKSLFIEGVGLKGLKKPARAIDAGNSGTTVRLLSGILAGQGFTAEIKGDESLSRLARRAVSKDAQSRGTGEAVREVGCYARHSLRRGRTAQRIRLEVPLSG